MVAEWLRTVCRTSNRCPGFWVADRINQEQTEQKPDGVRIRAGFFLSFHFFISAFSYEVPLIETVKLVKSGTGGSGLLRSRKFPIGFAPGGCLGWSVGRLVVVFYDFIVCFVFREC